MVDKVWTAHEKGSTEYGIGGYQAGGEDQMVEINLGEMEYSMSYVEYDGGGRDSLDKGNKEGPSDIYFLRGLEIRRGGGNKTK